MKILNVSRDWFHLNMNYNDGIIWDIIDREVAKYYKDWKCNLYGHFKRPGGKNKEGVAQANRQIAWGTNLTRVLVVIGLCPRSFRLLSNIYIYIYFFFFFVWFNAIIISIVLLFHIIIIRKNHRQIKEPWQLEVIKLAWQSFIILAPL